MDSIINYFKDLKKIKFNEIVLQELTKEDLFEFIIW